MKHIYSLLTAGAMLLCMPSGPAQSPALSPQAGDPLRMVFYNTENFFDARHDSLKNDEDFLPQGSYHWTWPRYRTKAHRVAQALAASGDGRLPALIGLAEIENHGVVETLLKEFHQAEYRFIHYESPDVRGIDVCLIYDRFRLELIDSEAIPVMLPKQDGQPSRPTRDILHASFRLPDHLVYHVFVCHWPSRYGGASASEPLRLRAAAVLRQRVEELFQADPEARIVIMGDLNDEPFDRSVSEVLGAKDNTSRPRPASLYNLMWKQARTGSIKSHKYQGEWAMLDHIIVSTALYARPGLSAGVVDARFLLEPDEKYLGLRPLRTYVGRSYQGGYSDHLPVYADIPAGY